MCMDRTSLCRFSQNFAFFFQGWLNSEFQFQLFVNSLNLYVASEGIFVFGLVAAIKPYTKVSLLKFSECLLATRTLQLKMP